MDRGSTLASYYTIDPPKMHTTRRRKEEILAFLMGSMDPNSPIALLDGYILTLIAGARCKSIRMEYGAKDKIYWKDLSRNYSNIYNAETFPLTVFINGMETRTEWRDPDDIMIVHRGFPDIDQPAVEIGTTERNWFKNGLVHRDSDMPAVVNIFGSFWYKYGKKDRDNNLPAAIYHDGRRAWFVKGEYIGNCILSIINKNLS